MSVPHYQIGDRVRETKYPYIERLVLGEIDNINVRMPCSAPIASAVGNGVAGDDYELRGAWLHPDHVTLIARVIARVSYTPVDVTADGHVSDEAARERKEQQS